MTENLNGGHFLIQTTPETAIFTPEDFSKENKAIAKSVKEFIAGEIQSRWDEVEHVNNELSRELMRKAGEIGLLAADIPEEYDGMALDKVSSLIISDILGQGAGSFTITELNHTGIGTLPLAFFGTGDQKKRYLPGLSSGQLIGAFGLTEPDAGSDALNANTTATLSEDGKHYILNGTKCFITNAGFADLIFAFAKVDAKAFTAFIVEFDADGISTDAEEIKMGMKGTSTRTVNFNNVKVPVENVLGEVGKGHVVALNALNMGRFKVGAVCVGNARGTFSEAVKYARQRVQFGQPICEFGLIKEKIGEMATRVFAGESMMYRTAGVIDQMIKKEGDTSAEDIGRVTAAALAEYLIECSIIKIYGSEIQGFVADESVQIFGGYGYIYENPAELSFRNARINRIWEGTKERKLLIQECKDCNSKIFYLRKHCPECWSSDLSWAEAGGRAKIYSYSITMGGVEKRFADDLPFVLALVDLEEGVRMMTNIVNCDPEEVRIGMDVEVVFEHVTDEITLPKWQPVGK